MDKPTAEPGDVVLSVAGLTVIDPRGVTVVDDVSFDVRAGEILGIAGVQGNGQTELVKSHARARPARRRQDHPGRA